MSLLLRVLVAESVYEDGDSDDAAGSAPNQPLQLD